MTRTALILAGSLAAVTTTGLSLPAMASDAHVGLRIVLGTPHVVVHSYAVCPPRVVYRRHVVYHHHYWPHRHRHHYYSYGDCGCGHHHGKHAHGGGQMKYYLRAHASRWHRD